MSDKRFSLRSLMLFTAVSPAAIWLAWVLKLIDGGCHGGDWLIVEGKPGWCVYAHAWNFQAVCLGNADGPAFFQFNQFRETPYYHKTIFYDTRGNQ